VARVQLSNRVRVSGYYRMALVTLRPLLVTFTRQEWRGAENLRVDGSLDPGIVVAANHISWADPFVLAHFLYDNGRLPRFLAKESLFTVPFIKNVMKGAQQIPVHRGSSDAARALESAVESARDGECVLIYPEGTVTRAPDMWPMAGKTGAVRTALSSGAALIPVAQWGAHELMRPYTAELRLLPRKTMHVWAGPPIDLDDLRGRPLDQAILDEATDRLMSAITAMLEQIRGEIAPTERYINTRPAGERPKLARPRKAG